MTRTFLLSPASASGERARLLTRPEAAFDLAVRLRAGEVTLREAMAFTSGLYFRGKLAYTRAFGGRGLVITTCAGLVDADTPVTAADFRRFGEVDIDPRDARYADPLRAHAAAIDGEAVLLGSISTRKYVPILAEVLGERLFFPSDFVGRGDMQRGSMMLKAAREGRELAYAPASAAPVPKGSGRPAGRRPHDIGRPHDGGRTRGQA